MRVLPRLMTVVVLTGAAVDSEALTTGISGREVFPGISVGRLTLGATFAGWTSVEGAGPADWQPIAETTGNSWSAVISYLGEAREAGQAVRVSGGLWTLNTPLGTLGGRVLSGEVHWPAEGAVAPQWPCWSSMTYTAESYAVATIDILLEVSGQEAPGTMAGCLDDIRWSAEQPFVDIPRIWGVIETGQVLPVPGAAGASG